MKYRRSRKRYISPGIEKLLVILCLALCFLAAVALFSSIGDYELPWLQFEEEFPEQEPSDVLPPVKDEDPGTDPSPELPEPVNPEDPPEEEYPEFDLDTPLIEITWDSRPVRLPVE